MSTVADRVRLHRSRARDGKRIFHLALDVAAVERLLEHEGLVDPLVEHDDRAVDVALEAFVEALAELVAD